MDQNNIISPLLFAVGGSNVAITGIFAFLGYIWSRRILQKEKLDHDKKLAELKSELDFEKSRKEKISDERFSLYTAVWHSLQDLKTIADRLWERADPPQFYKFINALSGTKQSVNRGRLILREEHYSSLNAILEHFENFRIGKQKLIEIRSRTEVERNFEIEGGIDMVSSQIISKNGENKAKYDALLENIIGRFRFELGLSTSNPKESDFFSEEDFKIQ